MSSVIGRKRALRGVAGRPPPVAGSGDRGSAPPFPATSFWVDEHEFMVILTDSWQSRLISRG
jgi:hypothetical protein